MFDLETSSVSPCSVERRTRSSIYPSMIELVLNNRLCGKPAIVVIHRSCSYASRLVVTFGFEVFGHVGFCGRPSGQRDRSAALKNILLASPANYSVPREKESHLDLQWAEVESTRDCRVDPSIVLCHLNNHLFGDMN